MECSLALGKTRKKRKERNGGRARGREEREQAPFFLSISSLLLGPQLPLHWRVLEPPGSNVMGDMLSANKFQTDHA